MNIGLSDAYIRITYLLCNNPHFNNDNYIFNYQKVLN